MEHQTHDDRRRMAMAALIGRLEARIYNAKELVSIDVPGRAMTELNVALSEARHFWETGALPPLT